MAIALGASAVFFGLALIRYLSFHSPAYDLGFFDQVLWNASHGHGLRSTFIHYSFFGEHYEPALLLFVPLYRLAASPLWLLAAQSLALGGAVFPLRALARRLVGPRFEWIPVAAYLLQVGVARAVASDFHTEALAVPFVFLAILFAVRERWLWFALCAVAPIFTKEDGALVAIGIGLLALIMTRKLISLLPAVAGAAYGTVVLFWVMPGFRHGVALDLVSRYAYLGSTPGQVATHALTRPGLWITHLATSPALPALLVLMAAVGFLPLLRPTALAPAAVPLLPALLSTDPYQAGLQLQYALPVVPLLMVAALLGWQRLGSRTNPGELPGGVALIAGAAMTWILFAPVLPRLGSDIRGLARAAQVDAILKRIPAGDEVAASTFLVPHLSERRAIWEFPAGFGSPWVIIDQTARPTRESLAFGYDRAVARLAGAGYHTESQVDGVTVWRKSP